MRLRRPQFGRPLAVSAPIETAPGEERQLDRTDCRGTPTSPPDVARVDDAPFAPHQFEGGRAQGPWPEGRTARVESFQLLRSHCLWGAIGLEPEAPPRATLRLGRRPANAYRRARCGYLRCLTTSFIQIGLGRILTNPTATMARSPASLRLLSLRSRDICTLRSCTRRRDDAARNLVANDPDSPPRDTVSAWTIAEAKWDRGKRTKGPNYPSQASRTTIAS